MKTRKNKSNWLNKFLLLSFCLPKFETSLFDRDDTFKKVLMRSVLSLVLVFSAVDLIKKPASAQQNAPLDLLEVESKNVNALEPNIRIPGDINQAIDQVIQTDSEKNKSKNETENDVNFPESDDDNGKVKVSNVLSTDSEVKTEVVNGSVKIGRRKISDVGLAAIGVGDTGNNQLDNKIWRGTEAGDAIFLLRKTAASGQSQVIKRLAYEVVARQSVPPSGVNDVAADFVEARLDFLASGGRSSDLAALAAQLPEAEKWVKWQRWLVEHYLMIRNDGAACDIVGRKITQTMEPFWHKSHVICQAVQGNIGGARFAADILVANGVSDPAFFGLVDEVLDNQPSKAVDVSNLESAHIVLMDVANRPIPLEALSVLPEQMTETVMQLEFLASNARMVSTFDGLKRGLITHTKAGKLWRNAELENEDPQNALSRLHGDADALKTVQAWRAIDADTRPDRMALVAEAVTAEIMAGNGATMLPLYSDLVRNAVEDETIASAMQYDDLNVAPKVVFMLAIHLPTDLPTLQAFGGNEKAMLTAQLLRGISDGAVESSVLSGLNVWHLLPIFEAIGVKVGDEKWFELAQNETVTKKSTIDLSPLLLKTLEIAAENRHVAKTILLANWILKDVSLYQTSPADLALVIRALTQIGQHEVAEDFATEIIKEQLMQQLAGMVLNSEQS